MSIQIIRKFIPILFLCFFLTAFQPAVSAEVKPYRLDPEKSRVSFEVGATFHTVKGEAKEAEGEVGFDAASSVVQLPAKVEIPVDSLDTGIGRRDAHMRKMFQAKQFPVISWTASSLTCRPPATAVSLVCDAAGTLKVKGIERETSFPVMLTLQDGGVKAEGSLEIRREDFDLKTPFTFGMMRVDQEIKIDFETFWS